MNALDKEEFRIKLEEINRLVEKKNYKDAMEVVDSIDWRRVKNVRTLCVVGEIYAANKRYEDSKEIFLLAYHRAPIGKNILYRLIEVSLKMKDISEAEEFYEEFLEVAPNDNTRYILKYKICKEKQVSLDEQIRILEEYKEKEFTERWSYELAKLYYQNGDTQKCLSLCDEMVLWFSDGKYVMKALDLKNRMGMLTGEEKEKYDSQFIPKLTPVEDADSINEEKPAQEVKTAEEDGPVIESVAIDERDVNSAESLQEKISKGIRDIFSGNKKKETEEDFMKEEQEAPEEVQEELIKDISSDETDVNVPELEPEDAVIHPPKNPGQSVFSNMEEMIEQVTEEEIKSGPEEPTAGENTEILESEDTLEAAEPAENVEAEKEDKAAENTEKQEEHPVEMKMPEDFLLKISKLGSNFDSVADTVLQAGGEVVLKRVKSNLSSVIGRGTKFKSRTTGELEGALGLSPSKLNRDGNHDIKVGFAEPRSDGGSNAKLANILEYGKHGQPAKPFLKPAKTASRQECIDAMTKALDEEVEKL